MMTFSYEADGITVTMETDATGLYEDYGHGAGVLGYFQRFLAAAGYSFDTEDELTMVRENEAVVDKARYWAEMEELDELREIAKAAKYAPPTEDRERANADSTIEPPSQDGWIEHDGDECPVISGTRI